MTNDTNTLAALADQLASLADKATQGPWCIEDPMPNELWIVQDGKESHEWFPLAGLMFPDEDEHSITGREVNNNAALIVALRNNLPAILEALRARTEEAKP